MTPKMRSPAENRVVCSTTTARMSSANRSRDSQVTAGPAGRGSLARAPRRGSQHLHVVEAGEVDERLDEDVLLEVAAGLRDLADGPDRERGRERAVLLPGCVDDLTLGDVGVW